MNSSYQDNPVKVFLYFQDRDFKLLVLYTILTPCAENFTNQPNFNRLMSWSSWKSTTANSYCSPQSPLKRSGSHYAKLRRKHARGRLVSGVPFILTSFLCGWITDACMGWPWFCPMVAVGRGYTGWQRLHTQYELVPADVAISWRKRSPHYVSQFNFVLHLNFCFSHSKT